MRKIFYGAVIVVILLTIGYFAYSAIFTIQSKTEFVVPQYVGLHLGASSDGENWSPHLGLGVYVGGGPISVSKLWVESKYDAERLYVNISGYNLTTYSGFNLVYTADIKMTSAQIKIDDNWLSRYRNVTVIFYLNGRENRYNMTYTQYWLNLSATNASNVISGLEWWKNDQKNAVPLCLILYPNDVGLLWLSGYLSEDKDYHPQLEEFAKIENMTPMEKVYPELQQYQPNNEKCKLWVVVRNRPFPPPNYSETIGALPNEAGILVNLSKDYYRVAQTKSL